MLNFAHFYFQILQKFFDIFIQLSKHRKRKIFDKNYKRFSAF